MGWIGQILYFPFLTSKIVVLFSVSVFPKFFSLLRKCAPSTKPGRGQASTNKASLGITDWTMSSVQPTLNKLSSKAADRRPQGSPSEICKVQNLPYHHQQYQQTLELAPGRPFIPDTHSSPLTLAIQSVSHQLSSAHVDLSLSFVMSKPLF